MKTTQESNIIKFIKSHDVECYETDGKLMVLDEYTLNGNLHREWIQIPYTVKAAKLFLNY